MLRLLRERDARLLLLGETLSVLGDNAMIVALGIWVRTLTGSNSAAGLIFFTYVAPTLVAPLGGLLVDRLPRRPLMIGTDVVIGLVLLLLLLVHDVHQVWLIYVVTLVYGASQVLFAPAQSALLTVMLPPDLLGAANGAFQTSRQGLRLVAPLIGAGLFAAFGAAPVVIGDSATFAASAICLALLRTRERREPPPKRTFLADVSAGARHLLGTVALRQLVVGATIALLVLGFGETIVFAVAVQGLHLTPSFVGVILSAQGVGAIIGGVTAARALERAGDLRLVGIGMAIFAVGELLEAAPVAGVVMAGSAILGIGFSWLLVAALTALQLRTPGDLQGRVYSAADMILGAPQTLSIAFGAAIATVLDYRLMIVAVSAVMACSALYLVTRRQAEPAVPASSKPAS